MSNSTNHGIATGNLASAPRIFTNNDGSRTVRLTVFSRDNFATKGEYRSTPINLEAFLPASMKGEGPYAVMDKGTEVSLSYSVRANSYVKNGETVYEQVLQVERDGVTLLGGGPRNSRGASKGGNQAQAASAKAVQAPQTASAPQVDADEAEMTAPVA